MLALVCRFWSDFVLSCFPSDRYQVVFDLHEPRLKHASFVNDLAHYFQKEQCDFSIGKKHVSFTISDREALASFLTDFGHSDGFHFIRVYEQGQSQPNKIESLLLDVPRRSEPAYTKKLDECLAVVFPGVESLFLGIRSLSDDLRRCERILQKTAAAHGFGLRRNSP